MSGDEGGFVMVWMALMLLVLLAFCGFGIDVSNWWYIGQKEQRAADAGALAGSIYMPNDLVSARAVALKVASQNGYTNGVNATVTATQEPQPSRIRVTITSTTTNFFAGLVGFNNETISRDAVADFQGPVPMGSPTATLGQDPDEGDIQQLWLNTSAPSSNKSEGDRFATNKCSGGEYACPGPNTEYSADGYTYRVRVTSIQGGQPLVFQVFDPAWINTDNFCNNGNMPNVQQNGIPGLTGAPWNITDVLNRYGTSADTLSTGPALYCTGDQSSSGSGNNTTYIVRAPDLTPWTDLDNPVIDIATCRPASFYPINTPLGALLDPTNGNANGVYVKNYFHRWATICSIPSASLASYGTNGLGDYVIQVKTNSTRSSLPAGDTATFKTWPLGACNGITACEATGTGGPTTEGGFNRYSIRAGYGTSSGVSGKAPNGAGVSVFATENLPIFANSGSVSSPTFYLARVTPTAGSGRTLTLNFYDIGDVGGGGSVTLSILAPGDSNYSGGFPVCTYHRDNATTDVTATGCSIPGMTNSVYNGRLVTMTIPIPADYNCAFNSGTGCWLKVRMTYVSAQPNDTTTWTASLNGDPVRLVE